MRLLYIYILFSFQSFAQNDSLNLVFCQAIQNAEKPPNSPPIYYFPFYNDVQLIEVDYYTYLQCEDLSRFVQPSKGLWYSKHVTSERTNGYILRNSKGEVLKAFGILNPYGTYLLPPDEMSVVTHKERLNSEKSLYKGQSFTWKDGNGFGYRYAVTTIREQRTEMPEMAYNIYGMLDTLGTVVIQPIHSTIEYFQGEYFAIKDGSVMTNEGQSAIFNSRFKKTYGYTNDVLERIDYNRYVNYGNKGGIMNHKGKFIEKYPFTSLKESYYSDDLIYSVKKDRETLYGVMSNDLNIKTKPIYRRVSELPYGYAVVTAGSNNLAIVNMSGKQITDFDYGLSRTPYNSDGTYILTKKTADGVKNGVIDTLGNTIIPFEYDKIHPYTNDLALVVLNGKMGIVDRNGEVQGEIIYDQITKLDEEKIQVQIDDRTGFINRNGETVEALKHKGFESLDSKFIHFTGAHESRWIVNTVTNDTLYIERDERFGKQGFVRVIQDGKRGMIDRTGNLVLPTEYNLIYQFRNGVLLVQKDGLYGLLDEELKVVEPLIHRYYRSKRGGGYEFYETQER